MGLDGEEGEFHSPAQLENQEETSEVQMARQGILCTREDAQGEYLWSFHGCEAGDGAEMDTESDEAVPEVSITEEETREAGDTDRYGTTDTADEESEPVLGYQTDSGRVDEGGDLSGQKHDFEDTQRVQTERKGTKESEMVTVHPESSGESLCV